MKVIVVYAGGFQPFHQGHLSSYLEAKKKFPNSDFYVATSGNVKERPIPYETKKFLATQAGVDPKDFPDIIVTSPLAPKEILNNYDPEKDVFVLVRSERDPVSYTKKDGSPGYYQPWTGKDVQPFGKNGYVFVTKKHDFILNGQDVYSGTQVRDMYKNSDDSLRMNIVKQLYPNSKQHNKIKKLLDYYLLGLNETKIIPVTPVANTQYTKQEKKPIVRTPQDKKKPSNPDFVVKIQSLDNKITEAKKLAMKILEKKRRKKKRKTSNRVRYYGLPFGFYGYGHEHDHADTSGGDMGGGDGGMEESVDKSVPNIDQLNNAEKQWLENYGNEELVMRVYYNMRDQVLFIINDLCSIKRSACDTSDRMRTMQGRDFDKWLFVYMTPALEKYNWPEPSSEGLYNAIREMIHEPLFNNKSLLENTENINEFERDGFDRYTLYTGNYSKPRYKVGTFNDIEDATDEVNFLWNADPRTKQDFWYILNLNNETVWTHNPGEFVDQQMRSKKVKILPKDSDLNEDEPIEISDKKEKTKAQEFIDKVYNEFPEWPLDYRWRFMIWGEGDAQEFGIFQLVKEPYLEDTVEVRWFSAFPQRQGVGTRTMKVLQDLAKKDNITLTLFPWKHGKISPGNLKKFYRSTGFKGKRGSDMMTWKPVNESTGTRLGDLCDIKTNFPDADFWIQRKGDINTIGKPTKEFKPEHIGIKVTDTDRLDSNYLYYVFIYLHNNGMFKQISHGTTNLQNIRTDDIKSIPLQLRESINEMNLNIDIPNVTKKAITYLCAAAGLSGCFTMDDLRNVQTLGRAVNTIQQYNKAGISPEDLAAAELKQEINNYVNAKRGDPGAQNQSRLYRYEQKQKPVEPRQRPTIPTATRESKIDYLDEK